MTLRKCNGLGISRCRLGFYQILDWTDSVWRVRKQVPADLREKVGKREIIVSTGSKDHAQAKVLALPIMARIEAELAAMRNPAIDLSGTAQTFLGQLRPDRNGGAFIDIGLP